MTIDRDGAEPIYRQIAAELRAGIAAGLWPAGRRLPSETELMETYRVARLTARNAVRVLASAGEVEVVRGRGTYVRRAAA
jgi:DNA-binding GntR family transcriptional regulator